MTGQTPRTPVAFRQVNELFHRALERPADERAAFLEEACRDTPDLRVEVETLLRAHSEAGTFLEGAPAGLMAPQADDPARLVGRSVGQYRIERVLGQGGMGVVYLARDLRLERVVALKAVAPAFALDTVRRERLRREARAAASLVHPGIATVYAFEEFEEGVFIAAEYVAGETLRAEISKGPSDPRRVIDTAIALATVLAAAHDAGVIHRDLKPENIMRTPSGQVKILDFGLAQLASGPGDETRLTATGGILGTPAYMAPEQIRQAPLDGRTDIFALGIVLFELATGAHPFGGSGSASTLARILELDPPSLTQAGIGKTDDSRSLAGLDQVIRTCLRKTPDARFSSAHPLLAALEQVRRGQSSETLTGAVVGSPLRWWKIHQAATVAAYVLLLWPLWLTRSWVGGRWGFLLFLSGLVGVVTAIVLRLHLWFAAASLPEELREQRASSRPWLRAAEVLFVGALLASGAAVLDHNDAVAALLISAALAVLISFAIIEPATTRATFGRD